MNLLDVEPVRRADVALDEVHAQQRQWHRQNRRPRAISAREALAAVEFEALVIATAAMNIANGMALSDDDRHRLIVAHARIHELTEEAL
jgi:hypothetical protein